MVGSNLVAGASQAAAAALVLSGTVHVWQLAALEAVNGASAAFTLPSTSAALPQTVPEEALRRANAVIRIGVNAASILGAALGGVVVAVAGPGWGIAVDAASFLVAAVLLGGLRLDRAERGSAEGGQGGSSMLRELAEGWREFRSRRWLWTIVVQFCFVNAAYSGIVDVLGPVVALRHLGGAGSWGIIVAVLGAGLVVGGLVLAWRGVSRMLLAGTVSLFAQVPFLACLAVAAPLPVVAVAALAAGIGLEVFEVNWNLTMQQEIPADRLSRVYSYDALGSFAFIPIGQTVAGIVQAVLGVGDTIWAGASVIVLATVAVLFVPEVRTLRARQAPASADAVAP